MNEMNEMQEALAAVEGRIQPTEPKAPEGKAPAAGLGGDAMQEALAAVEGQIQLAKPKIPEGKTLVAVKLDRDESRSGRFVEAITRDWQVTGIAIAIRAGHVLAGNSVFGRWTNGAPKVSAMQWVRCTKCGRTTPMPLAVWEAKDSARRKGIDIPKDMSGMHVLKEHGSCPCLGRWKIDDAGEKEALNAFADEALKALETMTTVGPWLPPAAFLVGGKAEPLAPEWGWMAAAMKKAGKTIAPFKKDMAGAVVIYNPGLWLGWVDDFDQTNLFWIENGKAKGHGHSHRRATPTFNPGEVDGL